jgi:hypothetical protein
MRGIGKAWPLLIVLLLPLRVQANPIDPMPGLYGSPGDMGMLLTTLIAGMLVEYLIVRWFLEPQVHFRQAAPLFFLINAITIPLTQILVLHLYVLAEILPLTAEPAMYHWFLTKRGIVVPKLTAKIVVANVWSFFFGIAWWSLLPPIIYAVRGY